MDSSSYNSSHRAFLQAFFTCSTISLDEAAPILAAIIAVHDRRAALPNDIGPALVENYIYVINSQISQYDYEIRSLVPQTSKTPRSNADATDTTRRADKRLYALVNTTSDPSTQLATHHKPEEIAFVKRLLDDMFERYNKPGREIMALTSIQALSLAKPAGRTSNVNARNLNANQDGVQGTAIQGMSKAQAETLLKALTAEGWLVRELGHYTLSPRSLMELRDWLKETYNEPAEDDAEESVERIKSCQACREIVTMGQRCHRVQCMARLHEHCVSAFFRMQREEQCPLCNERWTKNDFVGPKAASTSADDSDRDAEG